MLLPYLQPGTVHPQICKIISFCETTATVWRMLVAHWLRKTLVHIRWDHPPMEEAARQRRQPAAPAFEGEPPRRLRGLNPKRVAPGWLSAQRGWDPSTRQLHARGLG